MELLAAGRKTVTRVLVLVVSMGYGVVKYDWRCFVIILFTVRRPRLGNAWKQIVALAGGYMFFEFAYGVSHSSNLVLCVNLHAMYPEHVADLWRGGPKHRAAYPHSALGD